jgi:acyl-CoA synthetase (AMP-forming)/AMP-acid ligase II
LTLEVHVSRGSLVHTCFEKTGWYVVAILAINKVGVAWIPLDPSHPKQRKQHIVQQTRAMVALTSPANVAASQELGLHTIEVSRAFDTLLATKRAGADRTPPVQVSAAGAVYVLFTSGSTGTPKGIVMEHGAICTSQRAIVKRLKLTPEV